MPYRSLCLRLLDVERFVERVERGCDRRGGSALTGDRFERLQSVPGDVDDETRSSGRITPSAASFCKVRDRDAARRLGEDPLRGPRAGASRRRSRRR